MIASAEHPLPCECEIAEEWALREKEPELRDVGHAIEVCMEFFHNLNVRLCSCGVPPEDIRSGLKCLANDIVRDIQDFKWFTAERSPEPDLTSVARSIDFRISKERGEAHVKVAVIFPAVGGKGVPGIVERNFPTECRIDHSMSETFNSQQKQRLATFPYTLAH